MPPDGSSNQRRSTQLARNLLRAISSKISRWERETFLLGTRLCQAQQQQVQLGLEQQSSACMHDKGMGTILEESYFIPKLLEVETGGDHSVTVQRAACCTSPQNILPRIDVAQLHTPMLPPKTERRVRWPPVVPRVQPQPPVALFLGSSNLVVLFTGPSATLEGYSSIVSRKAFGIPLACEGSRCKRIVACGVRTVHHTRPSGTSGEQVNLPRRNQGSL